jgi:hypothetical protein
MTTAKVGYDLNEIKEIKDQIAKSGKNYIIVESEDNSEEYVNFQFMGTYEGMEVVYDVALYTLRMHHASLVYEMAEHEAAKRFPNYRSIQYEEDENGDFRALGKEEEEIGLFMAEYMAELEEEEEIKVQEHIEIDPLLDYGVGLDVGLNVHEVNSKVIEKFIQDYSSGNIQLDETLYSFQFEDEDDEDDY